MEIKVKKTVDMLTTKTVSILTQKFIELDGIDTQVGGDHRCAYANSETGRKDLQEQEPQNVVDSVFAIWGEFPTVIINDEEEEE